MSHLLVTGFGPFPTVPRNPSAALARTVAGSPRLRRLGIEARSLVLTTAYRALADELGPALAQRPAAILMIGVASRSTTIRVEWRATGRRSALFADVGGELAGGLLGRREPAPGPSGVRRSRVAPRKALLSLRRRGLPSRISRDAGRYLCNAAYFRALAGQVPVLFVHVPAPPRHGRAGWDGKLAAALAEIAVALVGQARVAEGARLR